MVIQRGRWLRFKQKGKHVVGLVVVDVAQVHGDCPTKHKNAAALPDRDADVGKEVVLAFYIRSFYPWGWLGWSTAMKRTPW